MKSTNRTQRKEGSSGLRDVFLDGPIYRIFVKGGRTWSMSKRGGARLFVAAGQPQGGGGFKGGRE